MDFLPYIQACILGFVEGLTEFLPVSSTGHLILAKEALGFHSPIVNMFVVVIQLGAILAVCWLYRIRLFEMVSRVHTRPEQIFIGKLFLAFLPAAIIGLSLHYVIEKELFSPFIVAVTLVIGGIIICIVEKWKPTAVTMTMEEITLRQAFLIGCAQAVSIIPGTSRSGATIIGGLLCKLDRKVAAEFSFFLAIPVMFAATGFDIIKYWGTLSVQDVGVIAVGFVVSFLSGLAAVKFFIQFVSQHSFISFGIYRIIFGTILLIYYA